MAFSSLVLHSRVIDSTIDLRLEQSGALSGRTLICGDQSRGLGGGFSATGAAAAMADVAMKAAANTAEYVIIRGTISSPLPWLRQTSG